MTIADLAGVTPAERVHRAYARIAAADRPEVWIHLRPQAEALAEASAMQDRVRAGAVLPLAGVTVAVKDNIDVGGLPTTAGCPAFAYRPERDAAAVSTLRAAGAIVIGKTALDQFATGLTGTRSPHGAVRDARRPERVSGGSSSGSAVAVALGMADLGLGTDTAGSGRIPAAFQGLVSIKPTRGTTPLTGVVPACSSLDCLNVFATELALARAAVSMITRPDPDRPERAFTADQARPPALRPRVAVPGAGQLPQLSDGGRAAFAEATERCLQALDATPVEIELSAFLAAGRLLYDGAFVAERYAAVGRFIAEHPGEVDPDVAAIIPAGGALPAAAYVADLRRLDRLRAVTAQALAGCDALLMPTAPFQPTIAEIAADPVARNRELGVYTTFANLLDLCAIALPAGRADGGEFGITLLAPAGGDERLAMLAQRLDGALGSCEAVAHGDQARAVDGGR